MHVFPVVFAPTPGPTPSNPFKYFVERKQSVSIELTSPKKINMSQSLIKGCGLFKGWKITQAEFVAIL